MQHCKNILWGLLIIYLNLLRTLIPQNVSLCKTRKMNKNKWNSWQQFILWCFHISDIQNGEPRPISAHSLMGPLIKQVVSQSPRAHKDNNLHFKISSQQKKKKHKDRDFYTGWFSVSNLKSAGKPELWLTGCMAHVTWRLITVTQWS